jgi:hypothetical protein
MHKEFAIEPGVIRSWARMQFLTHSIGWDKGRLLARFPPRWEKAILQAADDDSEINRKRMIEKLKQWFDAKLIVDRIDLRWNDQETWLANAIAECERLGHCAFAGIVVEAVSVSKDVVVAFDGLDEHQPPWQVARDANCARQPREMARVAEKLLRHSQHVVFVDPNFNPENEYIVPLRSFIEIVPQSAHLEYHVNAQKWESRGFDQFVTRCREQVRGSLPAGRRIVFKLFMPRCGEMHERFILTDIGVIAFDKGLNRGGGTTRVSLLASDYRDELWQWHIADVRMKLIRSEEVVG